VNRGIKKAEAAKSPGSRMARVRSLLVQGLLYLIGLLAISLSPVLDVL
jgi:hypothetical protein